jgi:hypothetical protein
VEPSEHRNSPQVVLREINLPWIYIQYIYIAGSLLHLYIWREHALLEKTAFNSHFCGLCNSSYSKRCVRVKYMQGSENLRNICSHFQFFWQFSNCLEILEWMFSPGFLLFRFLFLFSASAITCKRNEITQRIVCTQLATYIWMLSHNSAFCNDCITERYFNI